MGYSAFGELIYGFVIDPEDFPEEKWECVDGDWEHYYAYKHGIKEPECEYDDSTKSQFSKYWDDCKDVLKKTVVEIGSHGYFEEPMHYVSAMTHRCDYGDSLEITNLDVNPTWNDEIKKFCEIMEIKWQEPKWLLVSFYG